MYLLRAEFLKLRVAVIVTVLAFTFISGTLINLVIPLLALANAFGLDLSTNAIDYHPLGTAIREVDSYINAAVIFVPSIVAAILVAGEYGSRTIGLVVSLQGQRTNYIHSQILRDPDHNAGCPNYNDGSISCCSVDRNRGQREFRYGRSERVGHFWSVGRVLPKGLPDFHLLQRAGTNGSGADQVTYSFGGVPVRVHPSQRVGGNDNQRPGGW